MLSPHTVSIILCSEFISIRGDESPYGLKLFDFLLFFFVLQQKIMLIKRMIGKKWYNGGLNRIFFSFVFLPLSRCGVCFVHFKNLIFLHNTENRYFIFKETHKNFIYAKNNKQDGFVYVDTSEGDYIIWLLQLDIMEHLSIYLYMCTVRTHISVLESG